MTNMEKREEHYGRLFGPVSGPVMHSMDDKVPHIDVYQYEPNEERLFWTLITGGMSDAVQAVPADYRDELSGRTEILTYAEEPREWIMRALKGLGDLPFDHDTFLYYWHSVPGPGGGPVTDQPSELTCFLMAPPYLEDEEFDSMEIDDEPVDFLWAIPITDRELRFNLDHGGAALVELLEEKNVSPVIDESRKSIV